MPIPLSNHRLSNELLRPMSKRPTLIPRALCLLATVVVLGLPCDTLAAQSRSSGTTTKKLTLKKTPARSSSTSAARKRRAARAATAARAIREAQEPRFKLDATGALVPDVRAEAAIIYDSATGNVLW